MDKRLVIHLQNRSLAEYAVLMTLCAVGALLVAGALAAFVAVESSISPRGQFAIIGLVWLLLMAFLWLHFRAAAQRAQLAPSSTALFHTFQGVALAIGLVLILFAGKVGWFLFIAIFFGVEVAVGFFFVCYLFLAATLCRRFPLSALAGLAGAIVGIAFGFQHVLGLDFARLRDDPAPPSTTPVHRHVAPPH